MTALFLHHAVVDLHCFGGFVATHMFGLARTTNDIDFISLAPNHWWTRLVEIAKVRGSISGTVSKRMKLAVESAKNEPGQRAYKVKQAGGTPRSPPPPRLGAGIITVTGDHS